MYRGFRVEGLGGGRVGTILPQTETLIVGSRRKVGGRGTGFRV